MKVCQLCGDTYKDCVDFCFNDGHVLVLMSAVEPITEIPHASLVTHDLPEESTESGAVSTVEPAFVDFDDTPIDEDEPTQQSAPAVMDEDERTVPRAPEVGLIDDAEPSENELTPAVRAEAAVTAATAHTEPMQRQADGSLASVADPTDNEAPPLGVDDFGGEPALEEAMAVLQEPVVVAPPPSVAAPDYDSARTLVPADSLGIDKPAAPPEPAETENEPAPLDSGVLRSEQAQSGPTNAPPAPVSQPPAPPVPVSMSAKTLPLAEIRPSPPPLAQGGLVGGGERPAGVETLPLPPRPSATPTIPSLNLPHDEDQSEGSGAGLMVLLLGAFFVTAGLVVLALLGTVALQMLSSEPADDDARTATLPAMPPDEPLPPPTFEIGPDDDPGAAFEEDEGAREAVARIPAPPTRRAPGIPPGVLPTPQGEIPRPVARESKSISVVQSLNQAADGTGQRPVFFESEPTNALVELEGHPSFRTPFEVRLNVGERYSYVVSYPGYDPLKSNVMVISGSGVLRRSERLLRTPQSVPERLGPIVFGPQGCRLRVDGTLMESEDIRNGTRIDATTGRPMVYLPFQLKRSVLPTEGRAYTFQVVGGDGTPPDCTDFGSVVVEYTGQPSIVLQ